MPFHPRTEHLDLALQRRERLGVALLQLLHPSGEPLGQPLHLAVDGGAQAGKPLVLDHQRLDLVLGELAVAGQHLFIQRALGLLDGPGRVGLRLDQREAASEGVALILALRLVLEGV